MIVEKFKREDVGEHAEYLLRYPRTVYLILVRVAELVAAGHDPGEVAFQGFMALESCGLTDAVADRGDLGDWED